MGTGQGIFCPPEGLSVEGQARWWLTELDMFMMAHNSGIIPANVMAAIEQITKDNDLAFKIIDDEKVRGLNNEERGRIFYRLTNGGEWTGRKQGAPTKTLQDLRIAYELRDITDQKTRRDALATEIKEQSGGMVSDDGVYRRLRRIENLWQSVRHYEPEILGCILNNIHEDDMSITEDTIHCMAKLLIELNLLPND